MAEKDETTTTTTVDESEQLQGAPDTDTLAPNPDETDTTATTTVDSGESSHVPAERQGEQAIDREAEADVVGKTTPEQDAEAREREIESAKSDAIRNHNVAAAADELANGDEAEA